MYQNRTTALEKQSVAVDFEVGNSRLGIGIIMTMAAFVGFWGMACLVSGLANISSFQELGGGIITAITGM